MKEAYINKITLRTMMFKSKENVKVLPLYIFSKWISPSLVDKVFAVGL